mmetsp:Transcript_74487/g.147522  ORF Transcript_74487/g.147522 Transcript_74487/m.147522 type:complete len:285 (+) Transcript_74487:1368-2222(+)
MEGLTEVRQEVVSASLAFCVQFSLAVTDDKMLGLAIELAMGLLAAVVLPALLLQQLLAKGRTPLLAMSLTPLGIVLSGTPGSACVLSSDAIAVSKARGSALCRDCLLACASPLPLLPVAAVGLKDAGAVHERSFESIRQALHPPAMVKVPSPEVALAKVALIVLVLLHLLSFAPSAPKSATPLLPGRCGEMSGLPRRSGHNGNSAERQRCVVVGGDEAVLLSSRVSGRCGRGFGGRDGPPAMPAPGSPTTPQEPLARLAQGCTPAACSLAPVTIANVSPSPAGP